MKTRTWILISALVLLIAAGGFLLWYYNRSEAALTDCNGVEVYDLANFVSEGSGANKACLAIGRYTAADLQALGMPDNSIASMIVDSGFKATVYVDNNFTGSSAVFTANLNNLGTFTTGSPIPMDWDDKISSIEVEAAPACGIAVYDGANYSNWGVCLEAGSYNTTQLNSRQIPDNTIASIKVYPGFQATVYVDNNFTGDQLSVTSDLTNLDVVSGGGQTRWDDRISSIQVAAVSPSPTASPSVSPSPTTSPITATVSLMANDKTDSLIIDKNATVTLKWSIAGDNMSASKYCKAVPEGWFPATADLTGTVTVTPTAMTTYKLSCWPSTGSEAAAVSSQVVVDISDPLTCEVASLYDHVSYGEGGAGGCFAIGEYRTSNLVTSDLLDNISSVKVKQGYQVTLYDGDLTGTSIVIKSDTPDLSKLTPNLNNIASSFRVASVTASPTASATTTATATATASATATATSATTAVTLASPTLTSSGTGSTAGSGSAATGPETPLVAGGALTLIFASYFVVKKYLG